MEPRSISDLVRRRAEDRPEAPAFTFLDEEGAETQSLTCGELDRLARAVAVAVAGAVPAGGRALLLFPPGLDFLPAFFGCAYAGVVAVPVPPAEPRRLRRTLDRLRAVAADAAPGAVLTTAATQAAAGGLAAAPELAALPWIATDRCAAAAGDGWRPRPAPAGDLAYLQYTSGSTATPKGVMVSHQNLLAGSAAIQRAWGYGRDSVAVMWVPSFHDDGLVHGILQPLYSGFRSYLMSPLAVVERPQRWLAAIGRTGATHSGGPNFIYALAARRVPAGEPPVDLSRWRVAYNAAEPIRAETLEAFGRRFAAWGFRRQAMFPAYGLAEATLLVSTKAGGGAPTLYRALPAPLESAGRIEPAGEGGAAKTIVGCGAAVPEVEVVVADPASGERCPPDRVGEIWLAGPVVAAGYWNRPQATAETFGARLADGGGPYLRTGDLGFVAGGELYVTGRLKDLLILRGRNHYPQDVEQTVERENPRLRPGCGAAFALTLGGEERLVVVYEVAGEAPLDVPALAEKACREVAEAHEIQLHALVLVGPRAVPKTSSGKIQRRACGEELLAGALAEVGSWVLGRPRASTETAAETLRRQAAEEPVDPIPAVDPISPLPGLAHSHSASQREPSPAAEDTAEERAGAAVGWLREWGRRRLDSRLIDERRSLPPSVVVELAGRGLFGLQMPAGLGGLALSHRGAARVLAQLGALDLTVACLVAGHNSLGLVPLVRWAEPALREELLPDLVRGRAFAAFALTEPGAGSNPRALACRAEPAGEGWRLSGQKIWIGSAAWAGVLHTFAQVPGGGITAFAVRQGAAGLRIGGEALTMGLRGMVQSAVHYDGVAVAAADRLGETGEGMAVAGDAIALSRLFLGAVAVGGMRRAAQLMARFAGRRRIATGLLLDHPVSRARLGEVAFGAAAVEALVVRAAARLDAGAPLPDTVLAAVKVAGAEHLWRAADHLVQLLGGRGYVETNLAPQLLRDARIFRIFEGPTETLLEYIGSSLLHGDAAAAELLGWLPGGAAIAADLAADLAGAVAEVGRRAPARLAGGDRLAGLRWAHHLAGEMAGAALLAAALAAEAPAGAERRSLLAGRAEAWARRRFAELAAGALAGTAAESALLGLAEADDLVDELAAAIGEVEQEAPGSDEELDPLLRVAPAAVVAVAAEQPLATAAPARRVAAAVPHETPAPAGGRRREEIAAWISRWLGEEIGLALDGIDPAQPFTSLGLDSVTGVRLAVDLGGWLGRPVERTAAWDHPSIAALAARLAADGLPAGSREEPPAERGRPAPPAAEDALMALLHGIENLSPEEAERALQQELVRQREEAHGA